MDKKRRRQKHVKSVVQKQFPRESAILSSYAMFFVAEL